MKPMFMEKIQMKIRKAIRKASIEVLDDGEIVMGSRTNGSYMVREYEDGEELGGSFYPNIDEALKEVVKIVSPDRLN